MKLSKTCETCEFGFCRENIDNGKCECSGEIVPEGKECDAWELAGVLDVAIGVIGYARCRGTIAKRKKSFSCRLHIPERFFDKFLSTDLDALKRCKEEFYEFYGSEMIEKLKQNGISAIDEKFQRDITIDKVRN